MWVLLFGNQLRSLGNVIAQRCIAGNIIEIIMMNCPSNHV